VPIAVFGSKTFQVSSNRIYTISNFEFSGSLETETIEVQGKKPSTHIKGEGLTGMSFSIPLDRAFGVDVLEEIKSWKSICSNAIPETFILGGEPLSVNKWLLKSVGVKNTVIDNAGKIRKALLELTFEEYVRAGVKSDAPAKKSSNEKENISDIILQDIDKSTQKRSNENVTSAIAAGVKN
jgi:hypothetical protein